MRELIEYMLFEMTWWEYASCFFALLPWAVYSWIVVLREGDQW